MEISHGQKILKKELMVFGKRIINLGFVFKNEGTKDDSDF